MFGSKKRRERQEAASRALHAMIEERMEGYIAEAKAERRARLRTKLKGKRPELRASRMLKPRMVNVGIFGRKTR